MSESMCPLCGGELIGMEQVGIHAATGTEWGCQDTLACGASRDGCGARGRYGERGEPVAKEPDSARLDGMCGRLIDAVMASSDRGRVECLLGHYVSLRMWLAEGWHECDEGEPLWLYEYDRFEGDMKKAEDALPVAAKDDSTEDDTCTECGQPGDEGLCHDCWAAATEAIAPDAEEGQAGEETSTARS